MLWVGRILSIECRLSDEMIQDQRVMQTAARGSSPTTQLNGTLCNPTVWASTVPASIFISWSLLCEAREARDA